MDLSQSFRAACAAPDALSALPNKELIRLMHKEFPQEIESSYLTLIPFLTVILSINLKRHQSYT